MSKRVFRMVANRHASGGGEQSSAYLCQMAQRLGYHVIFHPTKHIAQSLPLPPGVELGPSIESGSASGDSDCLVLYANDYAYHLVEHKETWLKLLKGSRRTTCALNFVMGCAWQPWFSQCVDRFLFLNCAKEFEIVERLKKEGLSPRPTLSLPPPVDLTPYLSLPLPNYSQINFGRTGRYSGKYEESDYREILEAWKELSPESHYYFMATPPWMKKCYGNDRRFHLFDWDAMPVHKLLQGCSLYHYRLPQKMRDQGPRVLPEAFAMGIPCIGEPRDGALDRITSQTGWLCWTNQEFIEVVRELKKYPKLLEEKGLAARERARNCFNPWLWMAHITGGEIPLEFSGSPISMDTNEELIEKQSLLLSREKELFEWKTRFKEDPKPEEKIEPITELPKVEKYPTHTELGFGNGNLREAEWTSILAFVRQTGAKSVLDIGGGFSCLLEKNEGLMVQNIDNRPHMVQILKSANVNSSYYEYPNFPPLDQTFDFVVVSGPGPKNIDGRQKSFEFAKKVSRFIFVRDSNRSAEASSCRKEFPESSWKQTQLPMGLSFFEQI